MLLRTLSPFLSLFLIKYPLKSTDCFLTYRFYTRSVLTLDGKNAQTRSFQVIGCSLGLGDVFSVSTAMVLKDF